MSDDGTGGGISIPSMLISESDGATLKYWLGKATRQELSQLVLMAEFRMQTTADNKVVLDFWMTSSSNRALDFLEDFQPIQEKLELGNHIVFEPRYVFWECAGCDKRFMNNDCYGGGRYCAIEPSNDNIKGREIVLEDLR